MRFRKQHALCHSPNALCCCDYGTGGIVLLWSPGWHGQPEPFWTAVLTIRPGAFACWSMAPWRTGKYVEGGLPEHEPHLFWQQVAANPFRASPDGDIRNQNASRLARPLASGMPFRDREHLGFTYSDQCPWSPRATFAASMATQDLIGLAGARRLHWKQQAGWKDTSERRGIDSGSMHFCNATNRELR